MAEVRLFYSLSTLCFVSLTLCKNLTEFDLHEHLFRKYNPNVMPYRNRSGQIQVILDMYLMSIDDINEQKQTIKIKAFLESKWTDEFLVWDETEYPNIHRINVQNTKIWIPDLALTDTFERNTDLGQEGGKADIKSDGSVTIWPYRMYKVACKIWIGKFPFDTQTCSFDFLSWTNPSSILHLNSSIPKPILTYFTESGEWDLIDSYSELDRRPYGNDSWDHLIFTLTLKRKPLFLFMNAMLPVLCISILNIACFILPSSSGERVTLSISIFLTLAIFLTVVNSYMPESSDEVAAFSVFIGLQLFGSAFTILLTIVSLYFFHKENHHAIPCFLRALTKVCCTGRSADGEKTKYVVSHNAIGRHGLMNKKDNDLGDTTMSGLTDFHAVNELGDPTFSGLADTTISGIGHLTLNGFDTPANEPGHSAVGIVKRHKINKHVLKELKHQSKAKKVPVTWQMVSLTLDKICFTVAISWHIVLICSLMISVNT